MMRSQHAIWAWLLLLSACSRGGAGDPGPSGSDDLAAMADPTDSRAGSGEDGAGADGAGPGADGAGPDLRSADGLVNLPDGTYAVLAKTSRLEHITSGNPDRCPWWSALFVIKKAGAAMTLTSDTGYGSARGIIVPVDIMTGKAEASKPGMTSVAVKGAVEFMGGTLSLDVTYEVSGPGFSRYRWEGALASLIFGTTALPAGARRERLTWTDTNGFPELNTVDLLKDVAGKRWTSLPLLVGSFPMPMDTGMYQYTPPWDLCAGPSVSVRITGDSIAVTSKLVTATTMLPTWFR